MSKLQEIRKAAGLTQAQLAMLTGLTVGLIQKLETGERRVSMCRIENIALISIALKCRISDLIEEESVALIVRNAKA